MKATSQIALVMILGCITITSSGVAQDASRPRTRSDRPSPANPASAGVKATRANQPLDDETIGVTYRVSRDLGREISKLLKEMKDRVPGGLQVHQSIDKSGDRDEFGVIQTVKIDILARRSVQEPIGAIINMCLNQVDMSLTEFLVDDFMVGNNLATRDDLRAADAAKALKRRAERPVLLEHTSTPKIARALSAFLADNAKIPIKIKAKANAVEVYASPEVQEILGRLHEQIAARGNGH